MKWSDDLLSDATHFHVKPHPHQTVRNSKKNQDNTYQPAQIGWCLYSQAFRTIGGNCGGGTSLDSSEEKLQQFWRRQAHSPFESLMRPGPWVNTTWSSDNKHYHYHSRSKMSLAQNEEFLKVDIEHKFLGEELIGKGRLSWVAFSFLNLSLFINLY